MQVYDSRLPEHRATRAAELVGIVREHIADAMLVEAALGEIRQDKLYVELGYKTWTVFVEEELGLSRRRANQIVQEQRVRAEMAVENGKRAVPSVSRLGTAEKNDVSDDVTQTVSTSHHPPSGRVMRAALELSGGEAGPAAELLYTLQGSGVAPTEARVREAVAVHAPEREAERVIPDTRFVRESRDLLSRLNSPETKAGILVLRKVPQNAAEAANRLLALRDRLEEVVDALQRVGE